MKLEFSEWIFEKYSKFYENLQVEPSRSTERGGHMEGRTDRHTHTDRWTDRMKLIVSFF
jgi:hypothetical protein